MPSAIHDLTIDRSLLITPAPIHDFNHTQIPRFTIVPQPIRNAMGDNAMEANAIGDNSMGDNAMEDNPMGDNAMGDNAVGDGRQSNE